MYDSRLAWLKYYFSDGGLLILPPTNAVESTITTLLDDCTADPEIQVVEQKSEGSSFVALPIEAEKKAGLKLLYLIRSRESSSAIYRKLAACDQEIVAEYSVLPNWKNPRWFVPKARSLAPGRMPLMIRPSRPRSRAAVAGFRLLKGVGYEHLLCSHRLIVSRRAADSSVGKYCLEDTSLDPIGKRVGEQVYLGVIYTGSFGPIQKFTLELLNGTGHPVAFAKIGHNEFSKEAIVREGTVLELVHSLHLKTIRVPQSLGIISLERWGDKVLIQELLKGGQTIKGLSDICIQGLIDLFHATRKDNPLPLQECLARIRTRLHAIEDKILSDRNCNIRDFVFDKLLEIGTIFPDCVVPQALSHGDFTRWNVREDHRSLFVIDWEEADYRAPGHDLFNLLLSETLQVRKQGPDEVIVELTKAIGGHEAGWCAAYFDATIQDCHLKSDVLVILYLAEKLVDCLWHVEQHRVGCYPEKESFDRIITASHIALRHFCQKIESKYS